MVMALVGFQNNQPIIAKGVTQTDPGPTDGHPPIVTATSYLKRHVTCFQSLLKNFLRSLKVTYLCRR